MSMKVGAAGQGHKKIPVSMNMCFWCGECKEIIMGQRFVAESKHVPNTVCLNTDPCDKCKEMFSKGIHVMGVVQGKEHKDKLFPARKQDDLYLTGSSFVCKEESDFIQDLPEDIKNSVLKTRKLFMDNEIVNQVVKDNKQEEINE